MRNTVKPISMPICITVQYTYLPLISFLNGKQSVILKIRIDRGYVRKFHI